MSNVLRSEWIKLRTVTVHWVLAVIGVGFPVVITVLVAVFADLENGSFSSRDLSQLIAGLSVVSAMLLGSMAVISLTSEYSHHTIRPTYAATPNRRSVLTAKLIVNSVAVGVATALTVAVCWGVASAVLSGRGADISLGDDGIVGTLVSVVVRSVFVAWFGYGLGLVIRNSPATVTIFLLWPLLIENLIGLLFTLIGGDGATRWLPYSAGISATIDDEGETLGRPWGLVYFGAVTLAVVLVGGWLDDRRDA